MSWTEPIHYPSLDGVRGLAICLVLAHNLDSGLSLNFVGGHLFGFIMHMGWIGVQLFFVLSGFLITDGLLKSQQASNYYRAFFGRRVLRIFPLYYSALAFFFLLLPLIGEQPARMAATAHHQTWLWLYLSNWAQPFGFSVFGLSHFWSLAVEEQFYLAWPFVIHRIGLARLIPLTLAIALSALLIRVAMRLYGASPEMVYEFTVCRMDALALGACVAALLRVDAMRNWIEDHLSILVSSATVVLAVTFLATRGFAANDFSTQTFGDSALAAGFAVLILAAVIVDPEKPVQRSLRLAPLRLLGKFSYGVYVIHLPLHVFFGSAVVQFLGLRQLPGGAPVYVLLMSGISIACAVVVYYALERPFLKMKRLFVPDNRATAARTSA